MRKIYLVAVFVFVGFALNAAIQNVVIANNAFTPSNFTINIGDTIRWTLGNGTHNVTGQSIPGGAAAISSGTMSTQGTQYEYKVTVVGSYTYRCTFHSGMNGSFTVVDPTAAVTKITKSSEPKVYPNPFKTKVTINHGACDKIEIYTLLGEMVRSFSVSSGDKSTTLDLSELKNGVYLYVIKDNNETIETRRIVKSE